MSGNDLLQSLLACPVCHAVLAGPDDGEFRCGSCGRVYAADRGVADFTPRPLPDRDVDERRPLWEEVERNGLVSYHADPEHNLSVTEREVTRDFGRFAHLAGLVLDVGCGPQPRPSYAHDFDGTLVGIDPLRGAEQRDIEFVQGLGEYLPFRDGVFDRVLFATTLDHMLSPRRALLEAKRVAAPDGEIVVWSGDERTKPAFTGVSAGWYESLRVPDGAEDRFHVARFNRDSVVEALRDVGLVIVEETADGAGSVFVRARAAAA